MFRSSPTAKRALRRPTPAPRRRFSSLAAVALLLLGLFAPFADAVWCDHAEEQHAAVEISGPCALCDFDATRLETAFDSTPCGALPNPAVPDRVAALAGPERFEDPDARPSEPRAPPHHA